MLRVFLSSTFTDLKAEREAVEAGIQRMAARFIGMEHFGSFPFAPLEKCLEYVRSADVVVLLLGGRYGHVPEDSSVSMIEAEYQEAVKNTIPVLPYLQGTQNESWRSPRADPRLVTFQEELKAKHGITWFSTPEDLAWKVATDLSREFAHLLRQDAPAAKDIPEAILADTIKDRIDELVEILDLRAEKIRRELRSNFRYAVVKEYIREFDELHQKHVGSLRAGRMIQSHEILIEIHELSFKLSREEFWGRHRAETPQLRYSLRHDAFTRGPLICAYVAGDMKSYSERYQGSEGYTQSWRDQEPSPASALIVYQKVLATK